MKQEKRETSLSSIFIGVVTLIVGLTALLIVIAYSRIYQDAMKSNAITAVNRAGVQVSNMLTEYMEDTDLLMGKIGEVMTYSEEERSDFIQSLVEIREDVVAVTTYDKDGKLKEWWANHQVLKDNIQENLSYYPTETKDKVMISKPHVQSIFKGFYPWVVTLYQNMEDENGEDVLVCVDIRFSHIANYVDGVGIGEHGYCYIEDAQHNIIYHPQQQLIYSGLKSEVEHKKEEGELETDDVISSTRILDDGNWRVVGVCFVKEMVTDKVKNMMKIFSLVLGAVLIAALAAGILISKMFGRPAKKLKGAMREFEENAQDFTFQPVEGTMEIMDLSRSFEHMVVKIQKLMAQVREEEVSLKKTELKALQAQINPHFLYNTLDAIAWLCEDGRNKDAEEMVNALARLFRISISKGHEMIPIEKEVEYVRSYIKIQKHRYKDQFVYVEDIDKSCLQYLTHKITLQPFIENAIYHGLNRMVDEGEILVGVHQDGDDIVMTVSDNGMGMSEERCQEILKKETDDKHGIGIKNVDERIKIFFGKEYGVSIDSELDEGTTVTIRMPKVLKEGEYYDK